MNIFNIIDKIDQVDGDAYERFAFASRRAFMSKIGSTVKAAAVPTVLASIMNKAYAADVSQEAVDVLKFALTLEYLEDEFYKMGNANTPIPNEYKAVFTQIGKHETAHVKFLEAALGINDGNRMKPNFNFTLGGTLNPWTNFGDFVFLSHAFEDTGVRAYKGQAGALMKDPAILEYALQVHSVEARHAAVSRQILSIVRSNAAIKPWITNSEGSPEAVYKGTIPEGNRIQGGVDITGLAGKSDAAVSEAFDEPLTKQEATDIALLFIVS